LHNGSWNETGHDLFRFCLAPGVADEVGGDFPLCFGIGQQCRSGNLAEDAEDLAAFEERANEPLIGYEDILKRLKKDGRI